MMLIVFLGLVNWFATFLIVESEIFRPLRDWVWRRIGKAESKRNNAHRRLSRRVRQAVYWAWEKIHYLVECHACTGTWVGLVLALLAPPIFGSGIFPFVVTGLLIKAIGHLVLVLHKYFEVKEARDIEE